MATDMKREFWWIYSDQDEPWAGLRIAVFSDAASMDGPVDIFMIFGETQERTGIRDWRSVSEREGWRKVEQIKVPTI